MDLCYGCATREHGFELARSVGAYETGWGELVWALKFAKEKAVATLLSWYLATYLSEGTPFGDIDVLTYVPMQWADRRQRGFNQARLLARRIGKQVGIPVVPLLAKVRWTPPQAALSAGERRVNLRGAFRQIRFVKGKVLLVDDVYTTGATVEECARVLKAGGHEAVYVLTVARA